MSLNNIEITKETLIRSKVHEMILDGELRPGDKLPSENELSDAYDAKRIEARNALVQLEKMGIVYGKQGVGRFVNEPLPTIEFVVTGTTSFSDKMQEQNIPYESRVICADYAGEKESEYYRSSLELSEGVNIFKVTRLRIVNHVPCAIHISYIREDLFPNIYNDKNNLQSVYTYFKNSGYKQLSSKDRVISTQFPTIEEMNILNCSELVPLLVFETDTYDKETGDCLERVKILYRSDLFKHQLSDEN
ncbi:GntR family transcriptional regulator [Jeotgalicoccus aerolatus]|uniref:GntR family transcriptional regulator n=1 Tax=Jeotgalicoccus aerolatus TaxID=709510 RepID=A0A1G8YU40_9STAP|nr:GntR family transcriptional regulator [Jeotgalicoccus aerolatus]SDK06257.1 GntR family transcriptional regulator [Jeotgalicoccus aerolatus]